MTAATSPKTQNRPPTKSKKERNKVSFANLLSQKGLPKQCGKIANSFRASERMPRQKRLGRRDSLFDKSSICRKTKFQGIKPDFAEALNNRGLAFVNNGEFDTAIRDFENALKIKPEDAEALNNRGFAFAKKGEFERAISDYDDAIKLKPDLRGSRITIVAQLRLRESTREKPRQNTKTNTERNFVKSKNRTMRKRFGKRFAKSPIRDDNSCFVCPRRKRIPAPSNRDSHPQNRRAEESGFCILRTGFIAIFAGVGVLVSCQAERFHLRLCS